MIKEWLKLRLGHCYVYLSCYFVNFVDFVNPLSCFVFWFFDCFWLILFILLREAQASFNVVTYEDVKYTNLLHLIFNIPNKFLILHYFTLNQVLMLLYMKTENITIYYTWITPNQILMLNT